MTGQFDLDLEKTGQAAANLLPAAVRQRLAQRPLGGAQVFYAMGNHPETIMT